MERLVPPRVSASSPIRNGSIPGLRATRSHGPSAPVCRNELQRKSFQALSDFERIQQTNSSPPNLYRVPSGQNIERSGVSTAGSTVGIGGADEPDNQAIVSELPPVDRGRGAWTYLLVAFLVEGLCWGFPFSYGVFQAYYSRTESFAGSNQLSAVGVLSSVGNPSYRHCKLVAECGELQIKGNSVSIITVRIPNNQ